LLGRRDLPANWRIDARRSDAGETNTLCCMKKIKNIAIILLILAAGILAVGILVPEDTLIRFIQIVKDWPLPKVTVDW